MGLAIVAMLVKAHMGRITFETSNSGTKFCNITDRVKMKPTILIADDDKSIGTVLEHSLKDYPAEIKITNSAVELQN